MKEPKLIERYLLLYIPWILSLLFSYLPIISFFIAWLGSFYIFYLAYSGSIKELPKDLPIAEQLMRPVFLVHVIFAGYMCVTPIFNFLDATGIVRLDASDTHINTLRLELIAESQRYYCLAHAAYVMGILIFLKPPRKRFNLIIVDLPSFLMRLTLIVLVLSRAFLNFPGFVQFYFQLSALSFIAGTLSLIYSFKAGRLEYIIISGTLFSLSFIEALLSGFKEPIIVNILVLGVFLYPFYKRLVLALFIPAMIALFLLLPTYNKVFREKAWTEDESIEVASDAAYSAISEDEIESSTTWGFFTGRLSEVQMFTGFIHTTPSLNDFYGFELLSQSLDALVPRVFWPNKPNTEELVMSRVYKAGVINSNSNVSAKPALVVDGYLSGGAFGIFITLLIFGAITQLISLKAERLFGGYLIGTALVFTGLFQILWRGLSFEFLINSVLYSFITMLLIFALLRVLNVLKKIDENHPN